MAAFSRDDEAPRPWSVQVLRYDPVVISNSSDSVIPGDSAFYHLFDFCTRSDLKPLAFPANTLLTDNFFRPSWVGIGDRRLKTASLVLEWEPCECQAGAVSNWQEFCWGKADSELRQSHSSASQPSDVGVLLGVESSAESKEAIQQSVKHWFKELVGRLQMSPNEAVLEALKLVKQPSYRTDSELAERLRASWRSGQTQKEAASKDGRASQLGGRAPGRYLVAVSLAEGETLRRLLHEGERSEVLQGSSTLRLALRTVSGRLLDHSPGFTSLQRGLGLAGEEEEDAALLCFRFFNTDMYYSPYQVTRLGQALALSPIGDRLAFFEEGLRLRVRERNLWADTPVAKLFTDESEWHLLGARSIAERLRSAFTALHADGGSSEHVGIPETTLVRVFASAAQKEARAKVLVGESGIPSSGPAARGVHSWTPSEQNLGACIYEYYGQGQPLLLNAEAVQRLCQDLRLANIQLADILQLFKFVRTGCATAAAAVLEPAGDQLSLPEFYTAFPAAQKHAHLPGSCAVGGGLRTDRAEFWLCKQCTFVNSIVNEECAVCGVGWDGRRRAGRDQWECAPTEGGCSKYNPKSSFYCDVCGKARLDLANVRF